MAKKSKKGGSVSLDLIFKVCVLLFAVAAVGMLFLTNVVFTGEITEVVNEYTGLQTVFGHTDVKTVLGSEVSTPVLAFSFLGLLPVLFVIAGAVCAFVKNKLVNFVGAGLLVVAAVMFFLMPSFAVVADATNLITAALNNSVRSLGIGAILGGVFSVIAGALSVVRIVKK